MVDGPIQPRSRLDILVTNNTQTNEAAGLIKYSRNNFVSTLTSIVRFYLIDYAAARRLDFVWGWGSRRGKIGRENCINYSTPFKEGSFIVK